MGRNFIIYYNRRSGKVNEKSVNKTGAESFAGCANNAQSAVSQGFLRFLQTESLLTADNFLYRNKNFSFFRSFFEKGLAF
ncbi:MAG: hypothetical protein IKN72_11030 [Clostridia bacterium]|nr:hypothetical protein [Clostridia bacterium]